MNNTYIYAKKKLIEKYGKKILRLRRADPKLDSFITIDNFLANEMSLGPDAAPGTINYHYSDISNIYHYIKIMIKEIGFTKTICISDFLTKFSYKSYLINTIIYNTTRDELLLPHEIIHNLQKCSKNKRFTYINLSLQWEAETTAHANILIIDNFNKTIERYEPHGSGVAFDKNISRKIDDKFNPKLLAYIGLDNYKYISPIDISPMIGIQVKSDAYQGMCATYTIMYLQLRIMNPDVDQKQIIKYMVSKSKKEIYIMILKYAKYIENKLKDNADTIIYDESIIYSNKNLYKIKEYIVVNKRNDIDIIKY